MATHYEDVRLEPADNDGYILCYSKVTKEKRPGEDYGYSHDYQYKKEVFAESELQDAVKRMKELHSMKKMDV